MEDVRTLLALAQSEHHRLTHFRYLAVAERGRLGSPPLGDFEEVWKSQNVKTVVYRYINTTHWRVAREAFACALFDIIRVC